MSAPLEVRPSRRRLYVLLGAAGVLLGVFTARWYWRIGTYEDYVEYQATCDYALGPDLWFGDIAPGDDVGPLMQRATPQIIEQKGRWTEVVYSSTGVWHNGGIGFEKLVITAKDGKAVAASLNGCNFVRIYFEMNPQERDEWENVLALEDWNRRQRTPGPDQD